MNNLRTLSWEASDVLNHYAQILKDTNNKSNFIRNDDLKDPVTSADLKVNEIIISRINEKYKDISWEILSEENVKLKSDNFEMDSDWRWILDPLDGTKDFIQGTKNFAMHLALNYKNKPYIGVVLIPSRDELWIADGQKVWCEKRNNNRKNYFPLKKKILKEMTLVTSKNHRNKTLQNLIEKVNFKKVIVMGSIGCKIASILRGESDIYISLSLPGKSAPKDWDLAAPQAILNAAGGAITNIDNEELSYGNLKFEHGGIIIASNNKLNHENICLEIKDIIQKHNIYPYIS